MPADHGRSPLEASPTDGFDTTIIRPSVPGDADMVSVPRWAAAKVHDHLPLEPVGKLGEAKALLYAAATAPAPAPSAPAETAEDWKPTWRAFEPSEAKPLGLTVAKAGQGVAGLATFPAGVYPACSLHGAMNRVAPGQLWRCLNCNIGAELTPASVHQEGEQHGVE